MTLADWKTPSSMAGGQKLTISQIADNLEHERAWNLEEKKEDDEGVLFYLLLVPEIHLESRLGWGAGGLLHGWQTKADCESNCWWFKVREGLEFVGKEREWRGFRFISYWCIVVVEISWAPQKALAVCREQASKLRQCTMWRAWRGAQLILCLRCFPAACRTTADFLVNSPRSGSC